MELFGGRLRIGRDSLKPKEEDLKYTNKLNLVLKEDMLGWEGTVPFVWLDENFVQMPLSRTNLLIPREQTTKMTYMAWWDGFIAGARGDSGIKILVILTLFAVIGIGLFNWYTGNMATNHVTSLEGAINAISSRLDTIAANLPSSNVTQVV